MPTTAVRYKDAAEADKAKGMQSWKDWMVDGHVVLTSIDIDSP